VIVDRSGDRRRHCGKDQGQCEAPESAALSLRWKRNTELSAYLARNHENRRAGASRNWWEAYRGEAVQ